MTDAWERTNTLALVLAGGVLVVVGIAVLIGWLVPIPRLVQPHPGGVLTSFNAGVAMAAFGGGLIGARYDLRWLVLACGVLAGALALATLSQYLFAVDLGIDEFFVSHAALYPGTLYPGRMAANAAALVLLASIVLLTGGTRDAQEAGATLAWAAGVVFLVSGAAIVLHIPGLWWHGWVGFKQMSLTGGIGTMIGGVGLLALAKVWSAGGRDQRVRRFSALVFIAVAAVGMNLWQALASTELERMRAATEQAARSIEWTLTTGRAERYSAFRRLADRMEHGAGRFTIEDWEADARRYLDDIGSVRSLVLVGPDGELLSVVTRQPGLVTPDDTHYTFDDARRALLDEAFGTGQLVISPPMEMRLGGLGFQMVIPFRVQGEPHALVLGMSYSDVFEQMVGDAVPGYAFDISIGGTLVFDRSHGDAPARDMDVVTFRLAAPSAPWEVRVWPLQSGPYGILPLGVLALSLLSALLIAVAFRYSMIARARLAELTRESATTAAVWRASRDVLCTTDRQGRFVRVSDAARHLWGYEPSELEGKPFELVIHPEDRSRTAAAAERVAGGGANPVFINRNVRRDGTVIDMLWSSQWSDELGQMVSIGRDITALRDKERRLAAGEERLRVAVEQTGRLVYDRPRGAERSHWIGDPKALLGVSLGELLDMSIEEYVSHCHPDDQDLVRETFARALDEGGPYRMQYRWKRPDDGRWVWLEDAGSGMDGRLVAVKSDVTEQREIEAQLERRVEERTRALVHANAELEAFSYSVSHDLRTPLRAVAGFAELLRDQYGERLDETARHYLGRIETGAARMGMLIDDLLTLGRVSRHELERQEVDLSGMAQAILSGLQESEPTRNVSVHVEPGLTARCDARLAEIVLENLLGNAWKFTRDSDPAEIRFTRDGGAFCVADNGVGFDMKYVGQLFGVFHRLHAIDEFPGTGIGLATVRRIVERHGGRAWAQGEVGSGARFWFTFG